MDKMIEASLNLANDSHKSGFDMGREIGFNEGLQAAQELIGGKPAEQIILERRAKLKAESEFPSCSICRRDHGPEIVHECE